MTRATQRSAKPIPHPRRRRLFRALAVTAGAAGLYVGYVTGSIYAYGFRSDASTADAAVVLGAAEYNNRPSPVFEERIKHAIGLYRSGRVKSIIFTGGPGTGSPFSEAETARKYAVKHGVPPDAVLTEKVSRVTYDNLREARELVRKHGFHRVLIVSDPLHMKRSVLMARDLGIDAYPSPTTTTRYRTWRTKGPFLLRETYYQSVYLVARWFIDHK